MPRVAGTVLGVSSSSSTSATCPVCASASVRALGSKRGAVIKRDFSYHRCEACTYRWVSPFPGYEIYNEDYYEGRGADPFVNYASEYADYRGTDRVLEFDDLLRLASLHYRRRGGPEDRVRWLDFGCGAGGFLKFLRDAGSLATGDGSILKIDTAGHDIGAYADRLGSVDGFPIHSLGALDGMEGAFDVVSCIEVAEHVREVDALFSLLGKLLRPGGLLLLTTGNLEGPAARLAGLNYRYLIPEIHISLFSPGALASLYSRHGFEPLAVRYRGVVDFKIVKSVPRPLKGIARAALGVPGLRRAVDHFYGVSAMPCAVKR